MEMRPGEQQQLLSIYSSLPQEGREELLGTAKALLNKYHITLAAATDEPNKCVLKTKNDRPETTPEPVFTE